MNLALLLNLQEARKRTRVQEHQSTYLQFYTSRQLLKPASLLSPRARTPINLSTVLYEQLAARPSLPAKFCTSRQLLKPASPPSPRARILINPSTVLYEQADAQSSLPAKVSIIDLDFVPSVAFDAIENVELTGDLLGNADRVNNNNNNVTPTLQFSLTALLNPQSLASKRPALSSSDLNRGRTNPTIATSPAKRIKTNENCKKSTHRDNNNIQLAYTIPYPNPKKYLSNSSQQGRIKVSFRRARNNRNNLNIIVTNPTSREFGRAYNISKFYKSKNIQLLRPVFKLQRLIPREPGSIYVLRSVNKIRADVTNVFNIVISKSDKVPTREPSSYIKTELLRDNSRKFYYLIITGEDTHCKQIIKKAYIISPERASLILFIT
ncbi:hypothetical protein HBI76_153560 [Parastagonospora nodorum]|nr:hypothetical protein HBI76_153560 [Parastagonospora nodorum]